MAEVRVTVNGRDFEVVCGDGEEARLGALADGLAGRVAELAATGGHAGTSHLLVMAALMIAADLDDARAELAEARAGAAAEADARAGHADGVAAAAGRIEAMIGALARPVGAGATGGRG